MSATPKTDAIRSLLRDAVADGNEIIEHAYNLERQLNAANKEIVKLKTQLSKVMIIYGDIEDGIKIRNRTGD